MLERGNNRGQIAIFVIVAVVVVGGILAYVFLRGNFNPHPVNAEFQEVFDAYQQCIQADGQSAISIVESQGGNLNSEYIPGSDYAPFSSQLNFLGFPVAYWYYVSGNGVVKRNVPTRTLMERDIANYVKERLANCNLDSYYAKGLTISIGKPSVRVTINGKTVDVSVNADLTVSRESSSARKQAHSVSIDSKLGELYDTAVSIFNKEMKDAFLENYSVDVLRLYAPVDDVELSCSPKIWKTREVVTTLKNALSANIGAIKFDGNYYTLKNSNNRYFVQSLAVDKAVNLLYNPNWPTKVEIYGKGVQQEIMTTEPVGDQAGLGIMGFCYNPYHFVYDVSFPVMIQVSDGLEIFQFPVISVINKNMPRNAIYSEISSEEQADVCQYKTQGLSVNVYDNNLNKIDAELSYGCFNQQCDLGKSVNGGFSGKAPACVNGYLEAKADGYATKRQLLSTNQESSADIVLDKEYNVNFAIDVDGTNVNEKVLAVFSDQNGGSKSLVFPDLASANLSEGPYNISVYVYSNSSLVIPESTKKQCTEVPRTGISGFFGATQEQCVDITLPETKIDQALVAGGMQTDYLLASDLEKGNATIHVSSFGKPSTLEDLQNNFEAFSSQGVDIEFK